MTDHREANTAELIARARDQARATDGRFGPKPPRKTTSTSELGRMMRLARMRLGLTMLEVGEACGVGEGCVCSWEGGRAHPQAARLWRLVTVLELEAVLVVRACDPKHSGPQGPTSSVQEGAKS